MKCPYCGVHYMDDERECPICGKRSPVFGQKSRGTAHNHTEIPADTPTTTCSHMDDQERDRGAKRFRDTDKYPSIRHAAQTAAPKPASASAPPAKQSGAAKSTSTQAARSASDWDADKQKKKGVGAVVTVIVIAVLLQMLPTLIEFGETFVYNVRYSGESPVQVFEEMFSGTPEPDYAPANAPEPARTTPAAFFATSENRDLGITLALDDARGTYRLATPDREETGTFYWWYNDEEYYYTEEFPQDAYDCYTLCLDVSSFSQTGGTDADSFDSPYYLDAYFPVDDSDAPMTVLPSLDLPVWMEDETPIVLTRK